MGRILAILVLAVLAAAGARAGVRVSFPLQGYHRAGQFMPVRLSNDGPAATVTLEADGIVPTTLTLSGEMTVPLLVLRAPLRQVQVHADSTSVIELPGTALGTGERVIGFTGSPDPHLAAALFPDRPVLQLPLDVDFPSMPPLACEVLDALVVEGPLGAGHLDTGRWLEAGVVLVVRSETRPDGYWPWRREAGAWVLRPPGAGPRTSLVGEAGYLPAFSWRPGRDPDVRRNAAVVGAVVALLMLTPLLLPSRWRVPGALAAGLLACGGVLGWWMHLPATTSIAGSIVVEDDGLVQHDYWVYHTARREGADEAMPLGRVRPMLFDPRQAESVQLRADAAGWRWVLRDGARLAVLGRSVAVATPALKVDPHARSTMTPLARALYESPRRQIAGAAAEVDHPWRPVILRTVPDPVRP